MGAVGRSGLADLYPVCRRCLGPNAWKSLVADLSATEEPTPLSQKADELPDDPHVPPFLSDLARLEEAVRAVESAQVEVPRESETYRINPALDVVHLDWQLAALFDGSDETVEVTPPHAEEFALVWRDPETDDTRVKAAANTELVAVKMLVEDIPAEEAARQGGLHVQAIHGILRNAVREGFVIGPASRIRRSPAGNRYVAGEAETANAFTLQWHITQKCDLHCRHCYDRTDRSPLSLEQGMHILDDLAGFCRNRNVRGSVSFTGGNPLLHPAFYDLYRAAADRWFTTSILGNPASREQVRRIMEIQPPRYYQVSLEGLREHNDEIRGRGQFDRVIEFLELLREEGMGSAVMLTLTADNIDQVLPLAELLRNRADSFTFNRLSPVGEGADLALPSRERFARFLEEYVAAARDNPVLGFKDNLINIVLHRRDREPFGGCTGFGCGAAFNFLALLPDGQAHACRKFPSLLGNVFEQDIAAIYDSEVAQRYRDGTAACGACELRPFCGGCLAVAQGLGLDIFEERDPHCFLEPVEGPGR